MAKSWSDFLAIVRLMADDTKSPPKLTDDEWLLTANVALKILSRDAGPHKSATLTGSGGDYNLPDDFVADRFVEYERPGGYAYLTKMRIRPGDSVSVTGKAKSYVVKWKDDSSLTIMADSGDTEYTLYYVGNYPDIVSGGDLPFNDDWKLTAFLHLVLAYGLSGTEYKRARLEQYASAPELKVNNPPSELASLHMERYRRIIAESVP